MNLVAEYRLRNDPTEARQIEQWIQSFAETARLSPAARSAFDHALVEWITNVTAYAYDDAREHWIAIRFWTAPGQARVEVEDDGREFNPLTRPPVDTRAPLEHRPIGGLGIHIVRQMMDSVEYRREAGRNILTMTRRVV
jgi:anti-sigma regulatory factor (Ser/Thr protein kinase)